MRFAALLSGGKDSVYAIHCAVRQGHELVCCVNLCPIEPEQEELDSWMYQTVGSNAVPLIADALGVPLFTKRIRGESKNTELQYTPTADDEVEDMYSALKEASTVFSIDAVCSGALLSEYQKQRVENVCQRLGLQSLSPLWHMDQRELLESVIRDGIDAIIIKVAGFMLPLAYVGAHLKDIETGLIENYEKNGVSCVGEGGEYESFVLDAPLFRHPVVLNHTRLVVRKQDAFTPQGFLSIQVGPEELETVDQRFVEVGD